MQELKVRNDIYKKPIFSLADHKEVGFLIQRAKPTNNKMHWVAFAFTEHGEIQLFEGGYHYYRDAVSWVKEISLKDFYRLRDEAIETKREQIEVLFGTVYENLSLGSYGLTIWLNAILLENGIKHICKEGTVTYKDKELSGHIWIEWEGFLIDYRLRISLESEVEEIPHGIFKASNYPFISYEGVKAKLPPR